MKMKLRVFAALLFLASTAMCQYTVRRILHPPDAAKPLGPYSEGVQIGDLIFVAGNLGVDPNTGKLVPGGTPGETAQAFTNIGSILRAANVTFANIVKTTVLMADLNDFDEMNKVYGQFFSGNYPARATFQVAALPMNARVEIEAVAVAGQVVDITPTLFL